MRIQYPDYPAPAFAMTPRPNPQPQYLIWHHSDGSPSQTPLEIDAEHRAENPPFAMVGYSYMVGPNGEVWKGRPDDVVPAAAEGENVNSIDVCLLGDFQPDTEGFAPPTPEQLQSAKDLAVLIHRQYPSIVRMIGHRDVAAIVGNPDDATACPGDVLEELIFGFHTYVLAQLAGGK